jgi:small subunit ribosomal protein S9
MATKNSYFYALGRRKSATARVRLMGGIAKSLATMNDDLRSTLKRADLLSRDPRERERKKFGLKGARKQRQFTKR